MTTLKVLSFSLTAIVFFSCQNDGEAPAFDTRQLTGRWELVKAWRNHRPTETLTDTYYEFLENDTMKTNLIFDGGSGEYPFVVSGSKITQKSKPDEVVFTVEEFTDTLLTLSMVLRNYPFKIVLHKVEVSAELNVK
jgi:hypothetical protein